jgi:hypothetical protein
MSWGIAQCWLAVLGVLLVTYGTGAQAWANLNEFQNLQGRVKKRASDAIRESLGKAAADLLSLSGPSSWFRVIWMPWHLTRLLLARGSVRNAIILMPRRVALLYDEGGPEAVDLGRLIRAAEAWAILMIGSAFALVSAVIELALAYE